MQYLEKISLSRSRELQYGEILFNFGQSNPVCRRSGSDVRKLCSMMIGLGYHMAAGIRDKDAIFARRQKVQRMNIADMRALIILSANSEEVAALEWIFIKNNKDTYGLYRYAQNEPIGVTDTLGLYPGCNDAECDNGNDCKLNGMTDGSCRWYWPFDGAGRKCWTCSCGPYTG